MEEHLLSSWRSTGNAHALPFQKLEDEWAGRFLKKLPLLKLPSSSLLPQFYTPRTSCIVLKYLLFQRFVEVFDMAATDEPDVDVNFPGEEDYAHLIEDYGHLAPPSEGELLQGHVVTVHANEIIVDFGYKLEGLVPIEQLRQPDGTVTVKAGDAIDVMVDRSGPQQEGYILLSYSRASRLRIWDTLEQAMRDQLLVSGRVLERTKGGLIVDVGVAAFMPGSQVDIRPIHDLDQYVGQDIPVKILKLNRRRGN